MRKRVYILMIILTTFFTFGCGSIEDTYEKYAGDGFTRYLGKCNDLTATPGWKRIELNWVNSVDPLVQNTKITWNDGFTTKEIVIDKDVSTYNVTDLDNINYAFKIYALDAKGNTSAESVIYGRPFTSEHEAIQTFMKIVTKHFFINDNLIFKIDSWTYEEEVWDKYIVDIRLAYTKINGDTEDKVIDFQIGSGFDGLPIHLLEDVDVSHPVTLYRKGRVEGCDDIIDFDPIVLGPKDRSFSTDFLKWLRYKYNLQEVTEEFINGLEELEIDYSINSLDDILYFPNLKKLYLGKNRFLYPPELKKNYQASKLGSGKDFEGLYILIYASGLNGLEIDRYNDFYFPWFEFGPTFVPPYDNAPYVTEKDNAEYIPREYLDSKEWIITCNEEDAGNYDSNLENLFDSNHMTAWEPELRSNFARMYSINIDMEEAKHINGFKVVQKTFDSKTDNKSVNLLPSIVEIAVSKNGVNWENPFATSDLMIGNTNGEVSMLDIAQKGEYRYVRLSVSDLIFGSNFGVALSEFSIY